MADVNTALLRFLEDRGQLASILTETCAALIVIADTGGRIALFNRACERATGYRAGEVLGESVMDLFIPEGEVSGVRGVFDALLAGEDPGDYENHWRTRDGGARLIRWSNVALRDGTGNVAWVVGAGLDVTDYHRATADLRKSEARMRAVLDTAVDAIITIDEKGTMESLNPAAERMFGVAAEEAVGRNVSILMPPSCAGRHDGYIDRYLRTGERRIIGIGREVQGLRSDGTTFPAELAVSEVRTDGMRRFTGIVRDITGRKRAEQRARAQLSDLAHASRLATVGEMTSSIAHEINQPLAAIASFSDACLRLQEQGRADPATLTDALQQIGAQAARAAEVVRRVRRFAVKGETERSTVRLNGLVEEVIRLMEHELHANDVTVDRDVREDLPSLHVDPVQVQQVLVNLVRNGIEAMEDTPPAQRVIRVNASPAGESMVEVAVRDHGFGIGDAGERVFEAFFTNKTHGMGLGLSLSRSIVEAHAGRMWIDPSAGPGATFRFTLPANDDADD